jgi:hypothetical protein
MTKKVDKKELAVQNSSASEYLTFIASSGEGSIEVLYKDENIWLTQKMMSEIYDVDRSVITKHLKKIFDDGEVEETSVCATFAHTATDGKNYQTKYYSLPAVIAVGFKADNPLKSFKKDTEKY